MSRKSDRVKELKEKAAEFPRKPGVYLMKDDRGRVLYVGKAKSLRDRVQSYFSAPPPGQEKTAVMMDQIREIEYLKTDSEVDALLLESRLVKDIRPKYNKNLKDGKTFPYLEIRTGEDFPRVEITRDPLPEGSLLFGPFTDVGGLRQALQLLQSVFQFRTCDLEIEAGDRKLRFNRPCLLYHIDRCTGPCAGLVSKERYLHDIELLRMFLEGEREPLQKRLEEEMEARSAELRFEEAAKIRDQLKSLESLDRRGWFSERPESMPLPIRPKEAVEELQRELDLPKIPRTIEGIDIATLGGSDTVGALVTFVDGIPFKDGYRRFKIKEVEGVDDYASIRELVRRRYGRLAKEAFFPDLVVIDGGPGQLSAAKGELEKLGCGDLLVVSLAKREEEIYIPGRRTPIRLPRKSLALRLVQHLRDEAHRFAQHYHHLLQRKRITGKNR